MKKVLAAAALFATLGCGVESASESLQPVASKHEALCTCGDIPKAPRTPTTPTDLRRLLATGQGLYAPTVKSAYTVVFPSETDPNILYAWGYDVVSEECAFFVSLPMNEYSNLTSIINQEISQYVAKNPGSFMGEGIAGQVGKPIGPPHIDPWEFAVKMHAINN